MTSPLEAPVLTDDQSFHLLSVSPSGPLTPTHASLSPKGLVTGFTVNVQYVHICYYSEGVLQGISRTAKTAQFSKK